MRKHIFRVLPACILLAAAALMALAGCGGNLVSIGSSPVPDKPPGLTIVCGESSVDALQGTYSWQTKLKDGTVDNIIADSMHPLDCEDLLTVLETDEAAAALQFAEPPDRILHAQCWSDRHLGDHDAEKEDVEINGYEITLKPGGYIYHVEAEWNVHDGRGGTACYSFYIKTSEPPLPDA